MKLLNRAVCNNHKTNKQHFVKQPTPVRSRHLENATVSKKMIFVLVYMHEAITSIKDLTVSCIISKIMIWSLIFYHNFDHWSWFDLYDCGAHIYDYSNPFINWKKNMPTNLPFCKKPHIMNTHLCLSMWIWKHIKATMRVPITPMTIGHERVLEFVQSFTPGPGKCQKEKFQTTKDKYVSHNTLITICFSLLGVKRFRKLRYKNMLIKYFIAHCPDNQKLG